MKILVLPREDATPYQSLLYAEMCRRGVRISYLATRTPSHTLNLLLLPLERELGAVASTRCYLELRGREQVKPLVLR